MSKLENLKMLKLSQPKLIPDLENFTTNEYAEAQGISERTAHRRLKQLFKAGRIKGLRLQRRNIAGVLMPTFGWEIVKNGHK